MMFQIYVGYFLLVFCNCIHWLRVPDMDGKEIQTNGKDYQCNRLTCAIECSKLSRCFSFSHDVITNKCVLYDDVITTGVYDATSNWRYYTSSERPKIIIPCPAGYYEVSDMCFTVILEAGLGLEYSRLYCQNDDADLVIIDSERKQQIITPYLTQGKYYMIGLYSARYNSEYEWIDGLTDVNYTNWAQNEPSSQVATDQRCALMEYYSLYDTFQWSSYDCKAADGFICEITEFTPTITNG